MENKKAMSHIMLIVTIVICIILAGVVIVNLTLNNPVQKAKEAVFKDSIAQYKDTLKVHVSASTAPVKDASKEEVKEYIQDLASKHIGVFGLEDGKIIYTGKDKVERKWAAEVNVLTSRKIPPIFSDKISFKEGYRLNILVKETGDVSDNLYMLETSWDKKDKTYFTKYNTNLKKKWSIEKTISDMHLEGKMMYALSGDNANISVLKIEDKSGKILSEYKYKTSNGKTKMLVEENNIYVYELVSNKNIIVTNLDKKTGEILETKTVKLDTEIAELKIENIANNIYVYGKSTDQKIEIFKIKNEVEWKHLEENIVMLGEDILGVQDHIIYMCIDPKTVKSKIVFLENSNGKVASEINQTGGNISSIEKIVKYTNGCIIISKKGEETYVERLDNSFKILWSEKLNLQQDEEILELSIREKSNELHISTSLVTGIDEEGKIISSSNIYKYIWQ
ncbi:MAG: hypothetical protein RR922_04425 [Clostridia bacterium]